MISPAPFSLFFFSEVVVVVEISTETAEQVIEDQRQRNIELAKLLFEAREELKTAKGKIAQLEQRLEQRIILTENLYHEREKHFDRIDTMVMAIFRDNPKDILTYPEARRIANRMFPKVDWTNVDRRMRECGPQTPDNPNGRGWLGKTEKFCSVTQKKRVAYFLMLLEEKSPGKPHNEEDEVP